MKKNFVFIITLLLIPAISLAENFVGTPGSGQPVGGLGNPLNADSILGLVQLVLTVVTRIGLIVAAVFIVYSGFLFVTARGNESQITSAKKNFFYTVIGTAILLGAQVIITIITGTIGAIG